MQLTEDCRLRGTGALRASAGAAGAQAVVQAALGRLLAQAVADLYVRAWVLLPAALEPGVELKFLRYTQPGSPLGLALRVIDDKLSVNNQVSGVTLSTDTAFPVGRWACVELRVLQGAPGRVQAWLDEVALVDDAQDTVAAPELSRLALGINGFTTSAPLSPFELLVDEVVASGQRVGCAFPP